MSMTFFCFCIALGDEIAAVHDRAKKLSLCAALLLSPCDSMSSTFFLRTFFDFFGERLKLPKDFNDHDLFGRDMGEFDEDENLDAWLKEDVSNSSV